MKIVITGASGTIGTALHNYLNSQDHQIIAWDRQQIPIDNFLAMEDYLRHTEPDVLYHLAIASQSSGLENESWLVNYEWSGELAWISRILDIKFIFTSTVMVFSDNAKGPFTIHSVPDAGSGHGFEKRKAEELVFAHNPDALVIRLGWQIGENSGSNNMIDYLEKQMTVHGKIKASRKWFPACSFIADTVRVLSTLVDSEPGIYMIDSNRQWNFYEICCSLNKEYGNKWRIEETDDFIFDQRLIDTRLEVPTLKKRLKDL
jgi:dTDP-4-dehydrorhamnose reductase